MAEAPNYNETEMTGSSWQRACRVVVENPYQAVPSIVFVEEKVYNLGERVIKEPVANLFVNMDPESLLHLEIYEKLNELYILLRQARDEAAAVPVTPEPPPIEPPVEPPVTP
jgi:hypothetical protein